MARTSYTIDGVRVAQARQELELSQADLAERCSLHRVTMTRIENGAPVSRETLERLAEELGRSVEWLQGGADPLDGLELARERMAKAMSKIADGFDDFTAAVQLLEGRARAAADESRKVQS